MKKLKLVSILLIFISLGDNLYAQIPFTKNSKGRIAISSDGNAHDKDDWAATAASLMILAKANLQDKLTLYTYADHIWGNEADGLAQMKTTINGAISHWKFPKTRFIAAVDNKNLAYRAMRNEINKSTVNNPLYIIIAGPTEVVAQGMRLARASKRKFVTLISHSQWNEAHSDYNKEHTHSGTTWNEMKALYRGANAPKFIDIKDQNSEGIRNKGFSTRTITPRSEKWTPWKWMDANGVDESIKWVYKRMRDTKKPDISDAGMIWYLIKNDQNGNPGKLKRFIGTKITVANKQLTSIEEKSLGNGKLSVYPNPSSNGIINVSLNENSTKANVKLFNLQGQSVYQHNFNNNDIQINVKGFPKGVYILKINSNLGIQTQEVIIN